MSKETLAQAAVRGITRRWGLGLLAAGVTGGLAAACNESADKRSPLSVDSQGKTVRVVHTGEEGALVVDRAATVALGGATVALAVPTAVGAARSIGRWMRGVASETAQAPLVEQPLDVAKARYGQ